jgi:hypothetical protein
LTGKYGDEGDELIFKILRRGTHEARGETDLALRDDLSVPSAGSSRRTGRGSGRRTSAMPWAWSGGATGRAGAGDRQSLIDQPRPDLMRQHPDPHPAQNPAPARTSTPAHGGVGVPLTPLICAHMSVTFTW